MEQLVVWHRVLPAGQGHASSTGECARHLTAYCAALEARGGRCLGRLGGAVVGAFDPDHLEAAVELTLAAAQQAEDDADGPRVSFGISLGELDTDADGVSLGDCIDRAQLLANRARAYDILLDAEARQRATGTYLFGRVVGTGSAAARGHTIDRKRPRRRPVRDSLKLLKPAPVATPVHEALSPSLASKPMSPQLLVIHGPEGAGLLPVLRAHVAAASYAWVLEVGGVAGGLEPLGSLRRALDHAVVAPNAQGTEADPRALAESILGGAARQRDVAVAAWRELLRSASDLGGGLVYLRLHEAIDVASIELVGAGLSGSDVLRVIADLPLDEPTPKALAEHGETTELTVPPLRTRDARSVAAAILDLDSGGDLARRVGVLGGDTPMGVVEAARTLVASGDLVVEGGDWQWRVAPRGGVCAIPTEAVLEERLEVLGDAARRSLDLLAASPLGTPIDAICRAAAHDGIPTEQLDEALDELRAEALVDAVAGLNDSATEPEGRITQTLRELVLLRLPPARISEIRAYLAQAFDDDETGSNFEQAARGYLLAEGGDSDAAAAALLTTAGASQEAGWIRAAVRLAAIAVQTSPTASTRGAALAITRGRSDASESVRDTAPDGIERAFFAGDADETEGEPTARAVKALVAGDFETVDGFIDLAVAEGHDLAATDRLRAMAHLLRKDVPSAQRLLDRALERGGDDPRQLPRAALALAWVRLRSGLAQEAIRDGLNALARSRDMHDVRGEAAALHTLAACYRRLGRTEQAGRIAAASSE